MMRALTVTVALIVPVMVAQTPPVHGRPSAQAPAPGVQPPATRPPADATCPEVASALTALMRNDARLRDWPNLARYRDANRTLAAPPSGEARVVFMGDSITDGWQQPRYAALFPAQP